MLINFRNAITTLGPNAAFRIANAMRPPASYLYNTILPERNMPTYHVESGTMTVRSTMAGLVGMDSPYPPGGMVEVSTFLERTAKLAIENTLTEQTIRTLQDFALRMRLTDAPTETWAQEQLLNFLNKLALQPMLDRDEWLRGQAMTGVINWTFNQKTLFIDYGIPSGNILANRTGGDAYGGATSKWWSDIVSLRRVLKHNVRAFIGHPNLIDSARYNPVNAMAVVAEDDNAVTFRRVVPATGQFTADAADIVTIVKYGLEGEVLNPADTTQTLRVPFHPMNKLVAIGNNVNNSAFQVGLGSATEDPTNQGELGYHHIAPTVEGGGVPGRWSDLRVPDDSPWQLQTRAAENSLPVIERPSLIAVASSDIS